MEDEMSDLRFMALNECPNCGTEHLTVIKHNINKVD